MTDARLAARLAALGTGLGTLSHDLRGVLSPALMAAERLQLHADPAVRRSADVLVRSVERAIALLHDQLGPLRDGLPVGEHVSVPLQEVVEAATPAGLAVEQDGFAGLAALAEPDWLRDAWRSLFAHLLRQEARHVRIGAEVAGHRVSLAIEHDGQATLPDAEPDLTIARDLLRACAGELQDPSGRRLVVQLRLA